VKEKRQKEQKYTQKQHVAKTGKPVVGKQMPKIAEVFTA